MRIVIPTPAGALRALACLLALVLTMFAAAGGCSSGATPVCGPDAGCGPGPLFDTGSVTESSTD